MTTKIELTYPAVETLSDAFIRLMCEELTPHEMDLVRELNREETSRAVCHTHDFCDANMVMDAAVRDLGFEALVDRDDYGDDERFCETWNAAWSRAVGREFRA